MSNEDFLSRWSRRKRAVEEAATPGVNVDAPSAPPVSSGAAAATPNQNESGEPSGKKEEFDLASLPSLDSIVEGTDVSVFLQRGVPLDLTRAALRRAWSADPAIRDFIGLAENAWDFNDPNAMPGFGPLDQSPEQVRQMLAQVMGEVRRTAEMVTPPSGAVPQEAESAKDSSAIASAAGTGGPEADVSPQADNIETDPDAAHLTAGPADAATQQDSADTSDEEPVVHRTHGGALPR